MSLAIWSLAAQNVFIAFGPWRHKMFHCTLWSLTAQNGFIVPFGPWRKKFYKHATPSGSIFIIS